MSHLRTIVTTGADVVRDVEKLFPPELEYVELFKCVGHADCRGRHHHPDCPQFEDNSHAGDREMVSPYYPEP